MDSSTRSRMSLGALALIIAMVALGGAAAGGWAVLRATDRPTFCARCHEMRPFYDGWRATRHRDVPCTSCHEDSGFVPYLGKKVYALKEVWDHVTGRPKFPLATGVDVPDRRCLACHPLPLEAPGVRFSHRAQLALVGCSGCHAHTGHQVSASDLARAGILSNRSRVKLSNTSGRTGGHPLVVCTRCHDLSKSDCAGCHRARHPDWGRCSRCHPAGNWSFSHPGVGEHSYKEFPCEKCHPNGFSTATCKVCHRRGVPKGD